MTPREIDIEAARLSVEFAKSMRGQSGAVITAALTTSLAIFINNAASNADEDADKLVDAVAVKMKQIIQKLRTSPRRTTSN